MFGFIREDPLSKSRILIIKKLDTSQKAVAKALGWWLKADQEERVERSEIGDIVLYALSTAGQTLHHYILNGVLVLSNDRHLLMSSAELFQKGDQAPSVKNAKDLPEIGGPLSVVLHLAAYRDRQKDPPLALMGLQAMALRFRADSPQIESQLTPDASWGSLHNSPYERLGQKSYQKGYRSRKQWHGLCCLLDPYPAGERATSEVVDGFINERWGILERADSDAAERETH